MGSQERFETIREIDDRYSIAVYSRMPALFVRGLGCKLWDSEGREYLDFLAGIAVCQLGHSHPAVVQAISEQASRLMCVSNYLLSAQAPLLAKRLCELSGMDRAFFTNCGATANETALKIARKHGLARQPAGDYEIVALEGSFHGRTMGVLSLTGQSKYQKPFAPFLPGVRFVRPNALDELREAVSERTAAVFLEPILGEGGVIPLEAAFLASARELCDKAGALLVLDEVQTGVGRTGTWFHYQQHGIEPDLLALAKGLGSGMPIGACLARGEPARILDIGEHGTTFGGNLLACAVGLAVIETIEREGLLENSRKMGERLRAGLESIGSPIREVRGAGLMLAARLDEPVAKDVVRKAFEAGMIANATSEDVLRFVPPLVVTAEEIDRALEIVSGALRGTPVRA